jgi:hypothetical protein
MGNPQNLVCGRPQHGTVSEKSRTSWGVGWGPVRSFAPPIHTAPVRVSVRVAESMPAHQHSAIVLWLVLAPETCWSRVKVLERAVGRAVMQPGVCDA